MPPANPRTPVSTADIPRPGGVGILLAGVLALAIGAGVSSPSLAQTADLVDRTRFRVCADPANLPFSDKTQAGVENKLAELFARKLGVATSYTWFPQATGFIRNTLRAQKCDVVMGYVQGHELVQNTNHYYRSAYVLVFPTGSDLEGVESLDDARLKGKTIGVTAGTPPATVMAMNGLLATAKPFHLVVDRRFSSPGEEMISEIASGALDAGALWGPIAGFYGKKSPVPLTIVPLTRESRGPRMVYRITLGIRPREPDWKHQLNSVIAESQEEINAILRDFGVPLLDENDKLIN